MTIGLILIALAICELVLGLRFLFLYQKRASSMFYGMFAMAIALYVGANGLGFVGHLIPTGLAERLSWVGGGMTAAFFLPFSYSFPLPRRHWQELLPWIIWPVAIFVPGILLTDAFVKDPSAPYGQGYMTNMGPYFYFFLLFFTIYWIWSLLNLARSFIRSDGVHRWQVKMLLIGVIASLVASAIFDITLPLVTKSHFGYVGSLFSSIWLGFTAYVILKA